MHRRFRFRHLTRPALLVLLCAAVSLPIAVHAEQARMYRVEMVLFRHTDTNAVKEEVWQSALIARLGEAVQLHDRDRDTRFQDVSGTPFGLRGVVTRLEQNPLYEVIASFAWEQPGLAPEAAVPLRIQAGPRLGHRAPQGTPEFGPWRIVPAMERVPESPEPPKPVYEVDGTVTLSLARFLHVHTDLLYRRATHEPLHGDHIRTVEGGMFAESHVSERRRMRSREKHYLDHPMMGVIVEVTPLEN